MKGKLTISEVIKFVVEFCCQSFYVVDFKVKGKVETFSVSCILYGPQIDMSLHSDTLSWFSDNLSSKTTFIVFGLTWQVLKLMIYVTWGKHANHYTTDMAQTTENQYIV